MRAAIFEFLCVARFVGCPPTAQLAVMEGETDDAREDPLAGGDGLMGPPSEKVLLSSSPNLHSSALEEIGRHNASPAEEPLHTGWTFWFERYTCCRVSWA